MLALQPKPRKNNEGYISKPSALPIPKQPLPSLPAQNSETPKATPSRPPPRPHPSKPPPHARYPKTPTQPPYPPSSTDPHAAAHHDPPSALTNPSTKSHPHRLTTLPSQAQTQAHGGLVDESPSKLTSSSVSTSNTARTATSCANPLPSVHQYLTASHITPDASPRELHAPIPPRKIPSRLCASHNMVQNLGRQVKGVDRVIVPADVVIFVFVSGAAKEGGGGGRRVGRNG